MLKDIWISHCQWHENLRKIVVEGGPYEQGGPFVALAGVEIIGIGTTLSVAGITAITAGGGVSFIVGGGWTIVGVEIVWIGIDVMGGYTDSLKEK